MSFIGFDALTTFSGEVKRPATTLPLGINGTIVILSVLYIGVALVVTGMSPYLSIDDAAPLTEVFRYNKLNWAAALVSVGGLTTMTTTVLVTLAGQPRIFLQMGIKLCVET